MGIAVAGAIVGSLGGAPFSTRWGRRPAIIASSIVFVAGAATLALAPTWEVVLVGRLVVGIGVGAASAVVPVIIAECAPSETRGMLTAANTVCVSGGQFISTLVDASLSRTPHGWRYMFGLSALPAFIQLVGFLFFATESPRFLASKGRLAEARHALQLLRGASADIERELEEIREGVEAAAHTQQGVMALFQTATLRRTLLLACMLQFINQMTGINTIMYYTSTILKLAGVSEDRKAMWMSAAVISVFVVFTVIGLLLIERVGRRALMLGSLVGILTGLLMLAQAFYIAPHHSPPIQSHNASLGACGVAYDTCFACVSDSSCGFCLGDSAVCVPTTANYSYCPVGQLVTQLDPQAVSDTCPDAYAWLALLSLAVYIASFGIGVTSVPWVVNAEIFDTHNRSAGTGVATAVNWTCNVIVSMSFLTLTQTITTAGTFWLYAAIALLSLVYCYIYLPETRGLTLEEIWAMFEKQSGASVESVRLLDEIEEE